jgi:hypothetical protein
MPRFEKLPSTDDLLREQELERIRKAAEEEAVIENTYRDIVSNKKNLNEFKEDFKKINDKNEDKNILKNTTEEFRGRRGNPEDIARRLREDTESREKIFEDVTFEPVYDGRGNFQGYKSSAMGRKRIVLNPLQSTQYLNLDKDYRVRVTNDSEPEDSYSGIYTVEIIPEDPNRSLMQREAAVARAERLRTSGGFRTLAGMINNDPDLAAEYYPVVGRHQEYRGKDRPKDERHRNFTGMLSGLMMSERGNLLLNAAIDSTIAKESRELKEIIESEKTYVPGIVVGSGIYASILSTTRQMYLPDSPELTVEKDSRIGGQFAQYGTDLFRLNSRRRPEMPDEEHLPGTRQSLNSFGKFAPMQSADTGHEAYPYQSTLSDTGRVNQFLAGRTITESNIFKVRRNTDQGDTSEYIVEYMDEVTGRVGEIYTDRIIFTTGLGKETPNLRDNETTNEILKESEKEFKEGKTPLVMSFTQFAQRMSDPENPYPMKDMKRLVISGKGDSANVIAEIALGYANQIGKTSSQLDHMEEIYWIGQQFETKEEFLQNIRVRYSALGLEFPRGQYENYYSRIKPIPEARTTRIEKTKNGGIRVIMEGDYDYTERYVEGDHFIYAHGFEDRTDRIIAPIEATSETGFRISSVISSIRNSPSSYSNTTDVYYAKGEIKRLEILDFNYDTYTISYAITTRDGQREITSSSEDDFQKINNFFDPTLISYISRYNETYEEGTDIVLDDTDTKSSGREPIAVRYNYTSIFKAGPASNLPLTSTERRKSPALANIPENTASIFRYADKVTALAKNLAVQDKKREVKPSPIFERVRRRKPERLAADSKTGLTLKSFDVNLPIEDLTRIPLGANSLDLLRIAIGDKMFDYEFPANMKKLELGLFRDAEYKTEIKFGVGVKPAVPFAYTALLSDLIKDPLVGGIVKKLTDKKNNRSQQVKLVLPMKDGKIDTQGIKYEFPPK